MIGKSTLVWLCLATVASGILYHTSYRVQEEQEHLSSLNRQIQQERQSIQVLRAEWAYLNDPTRLERLATEHSTLRPTKAAQMVALAAIPDRPEAPAQAVPTPAPSTPTPAAPASQPATKPAPAPESTYVASAAPARPQTMVVALKAPDVQTATPVKAGGGKPAATPKATKPVERPADRVDSIGALMASLDAAPPVKGKVTLASVGASATAGQKKAQPILVAEQTLSAKLGAAR
ncbi:cell division protein FtsL [Nitrospirillum iridis]|uniref:Cell division protein FtsL n=1 Tax=Nitrospirillum iridis TaxID=765888 RepID=A0A7X0ATI7_9PROT|nr:hypothetical protein [Nitrospirillum iridis]MBB6249844.1 hypothetical protein [Nitrospirillum iridis]